MADMIELLTNLAKARQAADAASARRKEITTKVLQTKAYIEADQAANAAQEVLDKADEELRQAAREAYARNENLPTHVWVDVHTVVEYDPKAALKWCQFNFTPALALDKKVFETAARTGNIPIVTLRQEPKVKVSTDLSVYLDKKDDANVGENPSKDA